MRFFIALVFCAFSGAHSFAAEVIPPAPARYFNDYAQVVSAATESQLNAQLEQFERDTSNQIRVAIFPKMQSDSSIEDYTVRVARSWKIGGKEHSNGAVLFVFVQDRKMFIQVGYGLEGVLPDVLCKRIVEDEIKPHFRSGDFDGGLTAGVNAILAATRGEYKGTGKTAYEKRHQNGGSVTLWIWFAIVAFVMVSHLIFRPRGRVYHSGGSSVMWGGGGWSGGGGGSGGGGFSSGGGGSFGGGGAGGSW